MQTIIAAKVNEYLIVKCGFYLIFIFIGTVNYLFYRIKERKYYKAKGLIVDNLAIEDEGAATSNNNANMFYHPVVRFTNNNGDEVDIVSEDCQSKFPMYQPGTSIDILVNPDDDTKVLLDVATNKLYVPAFCIAFGVLGLLVTLCNNHH
jgi:hypothetical protein